MLTFYLSQVQEGNSLGLIVYYVKFYYPKEKKALSVKEKLNEKR